MTPATKAPFSAERLTIVPANEASWDDLQDIFGATDYPSRCQCQRLKVAGWIWRDSTREQRTAMLRRVVMRVDFERGSTSNQGATRVDGRG